MATNNATMQFKDIQNYQMLLNEIFIQKLEQNEKQIKVLLDYKKRHERVIEALKIFPLSLSMNCMVPIGKLALMQGKLIHTNEILVCLGDGYFAKYSASDAIALCNRRLAWTDKMLKDLETEKNLYEMRQIFPLQHDVFGGNDIQDIWEYSSKEELNQWKEQHKQHVKEYRQKIKEEKIDVSTEEDLFIRLDQLELQEEMEDEMWRLEAEEEISEEQEECISDYNKITTEIFEEELKESNLSSPSRINFDENRDEVQKVNTQIAAKNKESDLVVNSNQDNLTQLCLSESTGKFKNTQKKKTVSFAESHITKYRKGNKADISTSQNTCIMEQNDTYNDEDSENNDNTIKINFSLSSKTPFIRASNTTDIQSQRDFYRRFITPKSILKKSPNNMTSNLPPVLPVSPLNADTDIDVTDEDNWVIRDIKERKINVPATDTKQNRKATNEKEITSKFKMERARVKNK